MASIVTITAATETITCGADGRGEHVFSIANTTGSPIRVGIQVLSDAPTQESWLSIQGASERDLAEQGADQLTVRIDTGSDTAPGKYNFRLLVFSTASPGEDFTEGPTVGFEVTEPAVPTPKPTKEARKIPWWIAAVVAGVLVLGGLIWWLIPEEEELVKVPRVVKMPLFKALQTLDSKGLNLGDLTPRPNDQIPEQTVLEQNPQPNDEVEKGTEVTLIVSTKPGKKIQFQAQYIKRLKNMQIYQKASPKLKRMVEPEPE